ncbi:recombinase RecT [Pseudoduganella sp. SL102]|uniref:recombinase RecT n=1 Tax=Pseudoduganella sp. SL102 TaxID=2995154 RepID=UPI00248BD127|nr:recombinase RecT [Pseudoduganella sp. SL102]WBS00250.1 recombinase RecT [Pseudoduganella sp. SL102]
MNQVATSPAKSLSTFLDKYKGQIANALPKHITPDRMVRLTMTAFSQNAALQKCDLHSIFGSVVVAAQLGLEIGVGGQGYLVPYGNKATFVPGWQGLVDLVSRAGRATVWTGAVYRGDEFDWALGDRPFIKHRPGAGGDTWKDITHVYAVGRVNGSEYPVIEVWTMERVVKHLNKFNKVGSRHYALEKSGQNMEMYARKVVLLQVLKYMPKSIEVQRAVDVATAVDAGKNFTIDQDLVTIDERDDDQGDGAGAAEAAEHASAGTATASTAGARGDLPMCTTENFNKNKAGWREQIVGGKKTVAQLVAMIETRQLLTEDQKLTIDSWTHEND